MLSRLLRSAKGGPAQPEIQHLLRDMLVVSKRAFPDELEEEEEEESDDESLHSDSDDSEVAENPAVQWSEDESFLRTGLWSGLTPESYVPSTIGGNHFHRQRPKYSADKKDEKRQEGYCRKYKTDSSSHTPGVMLHWCLRCRMCVAFGMMEDAESPKTAFDHFVTLYKVPPKMISYDNG